MGRGKLDLVGAPAPDRRAAARVLKGRRHAAALRGGAAPRRLCETLRHERNGWHASHWCNAATRARCEEREGGEWRNTKRGKGRGGGGGAEPRAEGAWRAPLCLTGGAAGAPGSRRRGRRLPRFRCCRSSRSPRCCLTCPWRRDCWFQTGGVSFVACDLVAGSRKGGSALWIVTCQIVTCADDDGGRKGRSGSGES